jgi:hypothetical protein
MANNLRKGVMTIPTTYTILSRTDTSEYLSHFLFFDAESLTWTKNQNEAFCFRSHSDAECNARLILDRLDDPVNRRVGLKSAKAVVKDGKLVVGSWFSVNVCLVA